MENHFANQRFTGKIKRFKHDKGYGFIARPGFNDLFVHVKQVQGAGKHQLNEGDEVSFTIGEGRKGPEAQHVIVQLRALGGPATPNYLSAIGGNMST